MGLKNSGGFSYITNINYICTLLRGEVLCQLATLFIEVGSTTTTHLNHIILGLGTYFFPINVLSKQKRVM